MSYSGGKGGSGVYQKIINLMPPHGTYIEAFLGGGTIMRTKRPAAFNVGIEIDTSVWIKWKYIRQKFDNLTVKKGDAVKYLSDLAGELAVMRETRPTFGDDYLVYCDPPYLMSVRSSQQRIYDHEFHSDAEHIALLDVLKRLPCMVMISGYASELYDRELAGWRSVSFTGVTRGGPRIETVWLNFPEPSTLHDYRFLGDDRRKRQDIKRQKERWLAKLGKMPAQKRYAMLAAIEEYKIARASDESPALHVSVETENGANCKKEYHRSMKGGNAVAISQA